ncbi:branched-chain amino acid aminotransferase [Nocardioides humi]|uniref:Branched-chain-amino-acid aminotransferase n=1 Tax=Nocardioides humi TaxID=449461 RepID=A0ABN2AI69_9ACTN|nr:branched-chain amino acid aminotransferase [Nocardioides humi]
MTTDIQHSHIGARADEAFRLRRSTRPRENGELARVLGDPKFGEHFTDHMVLIDYSEPGGWCDARVVPYGPLTLDPASAVLHYGQEVFEGLKVYRHADGHLRTFRPEINARRFALSAARLALPELPESLFIESIRQLAQADAGWVPHQSGASLYVRPFLIATEAFLGVRPSRQATYGVIASPAGSYFADADEGISLWLSRDYSRAGLGGTGAAKCGGNYAASLLAQQQAHAHGCAQVLFTDASTRTWVEEAGSMNIFFAFSDQTIVTPPLTGTILAGVTRDSVLRLARDMGYRAVERPVSIDEWQTAAVTGELREVFAAGTAAVITPIAELVGDDLLIETPGGGTESIAARLRAELTSIQYGTSHDRYAWMLDLGPVDS